MEEKMIKKNNYYIIIKINEKYFILDGEYNKKSDFFIKFRQNDYFLRAIQ